MNRSINLSSTLIPSIPKNPNLNDLTFHFTENDPETNSKFHYKPIARSKSPLFLFRSKLPQNPLQLTLSNFPLCFSDCLRNIDPILSIYSAKSLGESALTTLKRLAKTIQESLY